MRALPLVFIALLLALGVGYYFATTRLLSRDLASSLPDQNVFEGPDLIAGYVLQRGLRGPESFIENPAGERVMPPLEVSTSNVGVVRLAISGRYILGEIAALDSGESRGFFLINTETGDVSKPRLEAAWRELVRNRLNAEPPPLTDADSFTEIPLAP